MQVNEDKIYITYTLLSGNAMNIISYQVYFWAVLAMYLYLLKWFGQVGLDLDKMSISTSNNTHAVKLKTV